MKKTKEYILGEIAHAEKSRIQFDNIGDYKNSKIMELKALKLWNFFHANY